MVWCCPRMVILRYNLPNARPWQTYRNAERAAWHDKTSRFVLPSSPFCNARTTQPPTAWPSSSWQQRRSKLAIRKNITLHGALLAPRLHQSASRSRSSSLPTSGFFSSMLFITEAISPLTASPSTPRALSMAATSAAASLGKPSSVMVCW